MTKRTKHYRFKHYDKCSEPRLFWHNNADMLHMRKAPKWMVESSRKFADGHN